MNSVFSMKIKSIILATILATFAVTYAYINFSNPSYLKMTRGLKSEYSKSLEFNACMTNATEQCSSRVVGAKLSKEHTVNLCDDYITKELRESCKDSFALENAVTANNQNLCKDISNKAVKMGCENEILTKKAINEKNPAPCLMIASDAYKSACLTSLIVKLGETEKLGDDFCNQISVASDKKMCTDFVAVYKKGTSIQSTNNTPIIMNIPIPQNGAEKETSAPLPFNIQMR